MIPLFRLIFVSGNFDKIYINLVHIVISKKENFNHFNKQKLELDTKITFGIIDLIVDDEDI